MGAFGAGDEGRHQPGSGAWEETWDFAFHTDRAELGGYLRIALHPGARVAWCWAALVGRHRSLLSVVDHDVALPRGPGLDLRTEGLWAVAELETPMEHWTIGLEAFGVELDDPTEAWRSGRGDRRALGFDLEWETAGPPERLRRGPEGYQLPCEVHGEVLVEGETLPVAGWGARSHAWGDPGWGSRSWCASSGRFGDGATWHAEEVDAALGAGSGTLLGPTTMVVDAGLEVGVRPVHHAPVAVHADTSAVSQFDRALCVATASDGRTGVGWTEWNRPLAGPAPP